MKNPILILFVGALALCGSTGNAIEKQQGWNWCWASCIQDVAAQGGILQTQTQVAARLDGWPRDRPAHVQEVVLLMQSYGFKAWRTGRPGSPAELWRSLIGGWKIIAFVRPTNGQVGHYIVLQGVDPIGNIVISDPATGFTYAAPLNELYFGWRWGDSVVVGR